MKRVLILGGGFGGIATAHHLKRKAAAEDEIILVDRRPNFMVGFRKTWALTGMSPLEDGQRVLGLAQTVGRPTVSIDVPGIYELRTPSNSRWLAVNSDPLESDLTSASAEVLDRWQAASTQGVARHSDQEASQEANQAPDSGASNEPQTAADDLVELAPWILALLAWLVFVEPLLANIGARQRGEVGA